MLFSLAQNPNPTFNRTLWKDDWKALNPEKQKAVALNSAQRAKNAEIELDSMTDMGVSVAGDFIAVLGTAMFAGRQKAKRDAIWNEWVDGGGDASIDPEGPFHKGEGGVKNPAAIMNWNWAPKTLFVPIGLFLVSLFEWDGQRYFKEAGFVSLLVIVAGMVSDTVYKNRLPKEEEKLALAE